MAAFVEVLVEATGQTQTVPSDWVGHPVLGVGLTLVEPDTPETVVEVVEPPSEVQLVAGTIDDLPATPAGRAAALEARAAATKAPVPTEDNTHDEIDAFANAAHVDLGGAKTKAEKVAVITNHLNPGGTEPSADNPDAGDKE